MKPIFWGIICCTCTAVLKERARRNRKHPNRGFSLRCSNMNRSIGSIAKNQIDEKQNPGNQRLPGLKKLRKQDNQEPAMVILSIKIEPVFFVPRTSTSLPMAAIFFNISRIFPAMVISSTAY